MNEKSTLQEALEKEHTFPCEFCFKFIVKPEQKELVEALVSHGSFTQLPSKGGKYLSITIRAQMANSEAVIKVYEKAKEIPGVIAL